MANFDLRTLPTFPSQPETDFPAAVLLGQMWWYAVTVLYPAQTLKSLGLYNGREIGRAPTARVLPGAGPLYCLQYREPSYLEEPSPHEDTVQYFDRVAAVYDTCIEPFTRPIYDEAIKTISQLLPSSARILDTGCGPGVEMFKLAALVPHGEIVGMDLSAGMVKKAFTEAQQRGVRNTAFFQADVGAMPDHFTGRFDATVCFGAFHHYPDPLAAVKEMRRALHERGVAFVVDPGPEWFNTLSAPLAQWGDPGWVSFYTGEQLQALFSQAGFGEFYWTEVLPGFGMTIVRA